MVVGVEILDEAPAVVAEPAGRDVPVVDVGATVVAGETVVDVRTGAVVVAWLVGGAVEGTGRVVVVRATVVGGGAGATPGLALPDDGGRNST